MSSRVSVARRAVRSRRKPVVAVTGATGPLGAYLLAALVARTAAVTGASLDAPTEVAPLPQPVGSLVGQVIGLDERRGNAPGVRFRVADISSPSVLAALGRVDVLVHPVTRIDLRWALREPAAERRSRLVRQMEALALACAAAGVGRLVVLTSAMVYGAASNNPVPLPEDAPLLDRPDDGLVGDLVAVERVLERARRAHPGLSISVVRPAAVVGPGVDTLITRHFEAPRLLTVKGGQPHWQFCHLRDLADAVVQVVTKDLGPVVTVGCEGYLTQDRVEQISGMRHVELGERAAREVAERLHRVGVLPAPASDLDYVSRPWVVGSQTLRSAGWTPRYDNETALGVLLEAIRGRHALAGRRLERREAALGATSAAVALIGTAAIMRRRRRRGAAG